MTRSHFCNLRLVLLSVLPFATLVCLGSEPAGLSARYPRDTGIEKDPAVFFADNFESGDMKKWDQVKRSVVTNELPQAGRFCVRMEMVRGKNTGGDPTPVSGFELQEHERVNVRLIFGIGF